MKPVVLMAMALKPASFVKALLFIIVVFIEGRNYS
jgi:hypothetical protein